MFKPEKCTRCRIQAEIRTKLLWHDNASDNKLYGMHGARADLICFKSLFQTGSTDELQYLHLLCHWNRWYLHLQENQSFPNWFPHFCKKAQPKLPPFLHHVVNMVIVTDCTISIHLQARNPHFPQSSGATYWYVKSRLKISDNDKK